MKTRHTITRWFHASLRALLVAAAGGFACLSAAQAEQTVTLQCEVVNPSTYLKEGGHGADLTDQTYEAAEGGQTLALLDPKTGTLYLLLTEEPGEDPNELVSDYANQLVTVTGRLYERGGMKGLVILSVEPPQPAAEPDPAAAN